MRDADTLLKHLGIEEYSLQTAIKVGSLFVRPKDLQSHLSRYSQRFVSITGDQTYQLQHLGTATSLKYRGRYFVISTNHQRMAGKQGDLGILVCPAQSIVTPSCMWIVDSFGNDDPDDCLDFSIFEYEPHKIKTTIQFFNVFGHSEEIFSDKTIALNLGYPTRLQNVDYYGGNVDLIVSSNFVELLGPTQTKHVYKFRTISGDRFCEDGMSGSPVFEVRRVDQVFSVIWLGLVVRGGAYSRFGRLVSGSFILKTIDKAVFGET